MPEKLFLRPDLDRLRDNLFDVIVIGGGITGAGIAQDAASRGLNVILFEKGDFASGTSSKSTKLKHRGLRYLAQGEIRVTWESMRECLLQQRIAPHMVFSLPFVIPTYKGSFLEKLKLRAGLIASDLMALFGNNRWHHRLSRQEVLDRCPGIRESGLDGGLVYYDWRTDDARHTLAVLQSALEHGAFALNYTPVTGFIQERGRLKGVEVAYAVPGQEISPSVPVYGRVVVNATGVWTRKVSDLGSLKRLTEVAPAKGIHITVSPQRLPLKSAVLIPSAHDKRFCFAVPWYDSIVIGTTDTPYSGDLDSVHVEPWEEAYILDAVNQLFPGLNLTRSDVTGKFAGLRPLVRQPGAKSTSEISRHHSLEESPEGLISISGGKLTTYRLMAEEVMDLVSERIYDQYLLKNISPCKTAELMLGGWSTGDNVSKYTSFFVRSALLLGLPETTARYLPTVYGKRTFEVIALMASDARLRELLHPDHPHVMAQVAYAVRHEAALTLEDVLSRRVRLTLTDEASALECAPAVAEFMAGELKWSETLLAANLSHLKKGVG